MSDQNGPKEVVELRTSEVDETALIQAPPANTGIIYDPTSTKRKSWAGFPTNTPEGAELAMRCEFGEHEQAADHLNTTIRVRAAYVKPGESMNPETGELEQFPITCLVLEDGRIVAAGSVGIFEGLRYLYGARGASPWEPPIPVKIMSAKTKAGRRRFYLQIVYQEPPAQPKRKGGGNG